jgi:hypothetical protein
MNATGPRCCALLDVVNELFAHRLTLREAYRRCTD